MRFFFDLFSFRSLIFDVFLIFCSRLGGIGVDFLSKEFRRRLCLRVDVCCRCRIELCFVSAGVGLSFIHASAIYKIITHTQTTRLEGMH